VDAALKTRPLLWTVSALFEEAEYHFYSAMSRAAYSDSAPTGERQQHLDAIAAHHKQLKVWAENCPENFENRAALVGAELARIESRDLEAMSLYEQAIRSARDNSFVNNEALANELASRFYAARGFEDIARLYLQKARYCYLRWGAQGKVRQLEEIYPHLRTEEPAPGPTTTAAMPSEHLDLTTVIKVSQAVSGEMVLEKLIHTLMRMAIEHAGAERGFLIVPRGDELQIQAEATTSGKGVTVRLRDTSFTSAALPESIVRYVIRTQENVILDDASSGNSFSTDPYIGQHRARSILCLPLINQAKLTGVLYLENNLTPHVFTPDRTVVLKVLASQAAISLENTGLYRDLENREAKIRRLVDANVMGIFIWNFEGEIIEANEAFLKMVDYDREDLVTGRVRWTDLTPAEWRDRDACALTDLKQAGTAQPYEKELFRKQGSRVPVLVGGALFEEGGNEGVAFVLDLTEQKCAEKALRRSEAYLAEAQKLSHTGSCGWNVSSGELFWSAEMYRIAGIDRATRPTLELVRQMIHPEDRDIVQQAMEKAAREGTDLHSEHRIVLPDGSIKHVRVVMRAAKDQKDSLEYIGALTDVTTTKAAFRQIEELKDQLQRENVALREEVDAASMFEEIIGTSAPLRAVLSRVSKVAPTDSTVLITGETGTGKELFARAIHKRSARAGQAFVSVNCAAIPLSLIHSELFGHERGAFTGAMQRKLGRFELARGGTFFLDEVGELPAETQVALLRVLQENEFERVGGTQPIRADVRLITATNRDLKEAIASGVFRSDLFYRLNVFPIEVPPLRERKEDIPILTEYFIHRFAGRMGKRLSGIGRKTLELFQSYRWPGNIRELQNVVERSVIVCETETFSVDESWLARQGPPTEATISPLSQRLATDEQALIEGVLAETHGRVSGPAGAAVKLGLPASTLESKIRALKINKHQFKLAANP
jgi:PAS domain S-box-containing protein